MANQITKENITIGIQTGTDRTIYATWKWTKSHTDHYEVHWRYATGDGVWFIGSDSDTEAKQSLYSAPENAKKVRFSVKPISKTYKKNKKDTKYWTAKVSPNIDLTIKKIEGVTPDPPEAPSLKIEGSNILTAELTSIFDAKAKTILFQVVEDRSLVFANLLSGVQYSRASVQTRLNSGHQYSVRCRAINIPLSKLTTNTIVSKPLSEYYSEYSEYADIGTTPEQVASVNVRSGVDDLVDVSWSPSNGAKEYKVEYTYDPDLFDTSEGVSSATVEGKTNVKISGIEKGKRWYFRVQAINDTGVSPWSVIADAILGTVPEAPTTWQSYSKAKIGENVALRWIHNDEDGSDIQGVIIQYRENGGSIKKIEWDLYKGIVQYPSDLPQKPYYVGDYMEGRFEFDTSNLSDQTTIEWQVKTKGILPSPNDWGPFSVSRSFSVYEEPKVFLQFYKKNNWYWDPFNFVVDNIYTAKGDLQDPYDPPVVITQYPFFLSVSTQPTSQHPLDYNVSILSLESYQTEDDIGETRYVNEGEEIFSKSYTFDKDSYVDKLSFMPFDLDLENNITYEIVVSVAFDSGLSAIGRETFTVSMNDDVDYELNAELSFDKENLSIYIEPYCRTEPTNEDEDGDLVPGVLLSVYRRTFDGKFVEIAKGLSNLNGITVIDPHPELNYARYRIVGISASTGRVTYYDLPSYPIAYTGIIIQWDQEWHSFDVNSPEEFANPVQSGSMISLPYNIDLSDQTKIDIEKVEYIGREHPVSYYGTQIGQEVSYNTSVSVNDEERIFAIRNLMRWLGNVYIRDPSGIGFWASLQISYSKTHGEMTVPISIVASRVDGGM